MCTNCEAFSLSAHHKLTNCFNSSWWIGVRLSAFAIGWNGSIWAGEIGGVINSFLTANKVHMLVLVAGVSAEWSGNSRRKPIGIQHCLLPYRGKQECFSTHIPCFNRGLTPVGRKVYTSFFELQCIFRYSQSHSLSAIFAGTGWIDNGFEKRKLLYFFVQSSERASDFCPSTSEENINSLEHTDDKIAT